MLRRLSPLLAFVPLSVAAPQLVLARGGTAGEDAGPVAPAAPPPPALVSPVPEVAPAAPQALFGTRLPPREAPEPPGAPPPMPEEGPEDRAYGAPAEDNWLDATHAFVAEQLFAPALVFDRFFSDETVLDAERSRSFVRWRNELRLERGTLPSYAITVRADLRLPGLNRLLDRLRLVVEGQTREAIATMFGEDGQEQTEPVGTGGAGLRLRLWEGLVSHGDLGAGVLLQLPPGAFARARLRWVVPVGDLFLARVATIGFWRTDTRFGTSVDAHLERGIKRLALLRLSSQGLVSEVSRGVEWFTELTALRAFTPTVFGSVGAGMSGATQAGTGVASYRVATRLRTDVYRRWLFVEAEPEVYWPWTPDGRPTTWAVTFRVEVQFRGWDAERPERPRSPAGDRGAADEPPDPPPEPEPLRAE